MALESRTAALAQKRANATYRSDLTGAMALLFIEACHFLIDSPEESQNQGERVRYNNRLYLEQIARAESFYSSVVADNISVAPKTIPRQISFEGSGR